MDAPEVISGPQRSLSYMLRRQPQLKLSIPSATGGGNTIINSPGSYDEYEYGLPKRDATRRITAEKEVGGLGREKRMRSRGSSSFGSGTGFRPDLGSGSALPALPPRPEPRRRFWGRRKTVWCLAMLAVVLVAAIGGGVGGSLAARRAAANQNPTIVMMPTTVTMMPPDMPTATAGETAASPNSSSNTASTASTPSPTPDTVQAAAIRVPTEGVIDFPCGRMSRDRQMVTLGTATWGFDVHCMMDYAAPGIDIAGMTAYSFGDCIRACAMLNRFARNNTCVGVFFSANLTTSLPRHGANCFLKSSLSEMTVHEDLAAAASLASAPQFM
ncbi:hypothetical protein VTJ49DRAFT_3070 [Mycothermus thermophilus]|uniref:Apple domain-containing protein n=1 Tax=Humicola insolens TaxID=85995 RepID=A0ABR3VPL2_HUMIN